MFSSRSTAVPTLDTTNYVNDGFWHVRGRQNDTHTVVEFQRFHSTGVSSSFLLLPPSPPPPLSPPPLHWGQNPPSSSSSSSSPHSHPRPRPRPPLPLPPPLPLLSPISSTASTFHLLVVRTHST